MRGLKEYIIEGIFDTDEDTIDKSIKDQIKQFLDNNFTNASNCIISKKLNKDGKCPKTTSNIPIPFAISIICSRSLPSWRVWGV